MDNSMIWPGRVDWPTTRPSARAGQCGQLCQSQARTEPAAARCTWSLLAPAVSRSVMIYRAQVFEVDLIPGVGSVCCCSSQGPTS